MTSRAPVALCVVLIGSCDCAAGDDAELGTVAPPPQPPTPAEAAPAEPEDEPATFTPPTEQTLRAIRRTVAEGRGHARDGDLTAAAASFERALELAPNEGRILCELGFVRMRAGDAEAAARDTDLGLRALHQHEPRDERERNGLGACLYNRGRLFEDAGDAEKARAFYRHSLTFRENRTVRERLATLGDEGEAPGLGVLLAPARPGPTGACDAFFSLDHVVRGFDEDCIDEECDPVEVVREQDVGTLRAALLSVEAPGALEADLYLVVRSPDGWTISRDPVGNYFTAMSALYHGAAHDYSIRAVQIGETRGLVVSYVRDDFTTNAPDLFAVDDEEEWDYQLEESSESVRHLAFVSLAGDCPELRLQATVEREFATRAQGGSETGECGVEHAIEGDELVVRNPTGSEDCLDSLEQPGRYPLL